MEASATTVTISQPSPNAQVQTVTMEVKHNHKPNFGRYVADCPKCVAIHPDGPVKRERKVKPPEPTGMTRDEIIAMLREHAPTVAASGNNQLEQLVQLMLSKEAKTLKKEAEIDAKRQQAREDMIRITREHETMVATNQAACGHLKENGRSAVGGQVHNDGLYHAFCQRCFKTFPPRRPNHEEMPTGVSAY